MKTDSFPITVSDGGVSAKIRKVTKSRNGTAYDSFVVDYFLLGKRKLVWRAELEDAKQVARDACGRIAAGEQQVLTLTNTDRMTYIRAKEYADKVGAPLSVHPFNLPVLVGQMDGLPVSNPIASGIASATV